ncbi:MAG: aminotransferase class V-fold PLP-dependent enzyme [Alphaproteobacteria bacterium]|nr:aminotransferase class V-fold PLP-dependent enzyme [Alphaproteobacteria bacterium]
MAAESASQQSDGTGRCKSFGAAARSDFMFEAGLTYLNHGAYGVTSRPVMAAAQAFRERIESQPSYFLTTVLSPELRASAQILGQYVGAKGEDIVFQDNATTAINAVLRSLVLFPGDEVLTTSLTYGAVMRTLEFVCDRADARLIPVHIDYPMSDAETVVETIVAAISPRTRLLVIDHVTSKTASILPIAEIAAECRDRGILVLVDGAHAPAMLDLDIESLGVTWYTGNCHKWLGAPRGSAFLWTVAERQAYLRPTTISHFIADGYVPAFDWPGTKDFTPYLTIPAALEYRALYGEDRIRSYCNTLAYEAGQHVAKGLGTHIGIPKSMAAAMMTIAMPDGYGPAKQDNANALRNEIRKTHNLEIDIQAFERRLWLRLSAYIYNDMDDADRLLHAVKAVKAG